MKSRIICGCIAIACSLNTFAQKSIGRTIFPPIIYALDKNADLLWYQHTGYKNASFEWSNKTGAKVGQGWNGFTRIFYDGSGHIYAIKPNGDLCWYDHSGYMNGSFLWGQASGAVVGTYWNNPDYKGVFAGGNGVIYILKTNGDLLWYRHLGFRDGSATWHPNSGTRVGSGWTQFYDVFSGGKGVIYLITLNGDLFWYEHTGYITGTSTWRGSGYANLVGKGWNSFSRIISTGEGNIYALSSNGMLRYYHHLGYGSGANSWGSGSSNQVGAGWSGVNIFGLGGVTR